ncbi:helix-turn-helix domain-containing protein [Thermomonospora umbrina]|uniref:Helix-turn-helix protein n=1 Tax=Thermomonospora umbrina TaxID=111806 RepID=A0A3D9SRN6_9ACTN|nr:helix-turn-helix transcriptional regulator [Thermomonospora umbrina]REE98267.1 helix-turn-helix protein [Thermomonospora umbrina]
MSTNELGAFLRSRRDAITPAQVGLPGGGRRRTPGLRRAELAAVAGISVEYLTRLEQGRDRHPSLQVITALAGALRLSPDDRELLRRTAKAADGSYACMLGHTPPTLTVRPTVRALLDGIAAPALVVNRLGDVVACTPAYERTAGPLGVLDAATPNLLRFVFTDARSRTAFPDWERVADEQVLQLRAASTLTDPHASELVEELTVAAGAAFTERLQAPPGHPLYAGITRLAHPEAGELRLAFEILDLPADDGQRLVVHLPADDTTAAALDRLTGRRPGALRAVRTANA